MVLEAPPGAGKTTLAPLAILEAAQNTWLAGQKILMLEPRRLAAKGAAERMAQLLNESVGQTVGYRVRLDSKVSAATRIEVITEGILTRMLQSDPSLESVGLVIFDEFHERSLDGDLGLALCLQGREMFREDDSETPLKLLVMSATLDGASISALLDDAPVVRSEGRQYPVDIIYGEPSRLGENPCPAVANTVLQALREQEGSVLVFLPGQGEIRQVHERLEYALTELHGDTGPAIELCPLYGDLSLDQQRKAIAPMEKGKRKVVLATAIAESSLTIEGIRVVVDAGLSREPIFDPPTGMTRLHTKRLSAASSVQRAGRAGRLEPGVCYRLWSESQQQQLQAFTAPEIEQADLAPLALQLLCWGVSDPAELQWLNPPAKAPYQQALDLLQQLGAVAASDGTSGDVGLGVVTADSYQLTAHGEAMASLPCHPRLAHLLLVAKAFDQVELGIQLAALLSERDLLAKHHTADIAERLALISGEVKASHHQKGRLHRIRQQVKQYQQLLERERISVPDSASQSLSSSTEAYTQEQWLGVFLASAYPDRVAKQRKAGGVDFQLSNGRSAQLSTEDRLTRYKWLAVAQLGSRAGSANEQVYLAAPLDSCLFETVLADQLQEKIVVEWDKREERFIAERQLCLGALVVSTSIMEDIPAETKQKVLADLVRQRGLSLLPWTEEIQQWRNRVNTVDQHKQLLKREDSDPWPDLSDQALLSTLEQWLGPYLSDINHINHFAKLDLKSILLGLLPWPLPQALDRLAPERIKVPSGSQIRVDYSQQPPVLAVKLQEMFGCAETPRVLEGRLPLKIHLLSPARRPLQVTQDLASFWANAYTDVKKDMKGRYPKHPWPDDPLSAVATARANPKPKSKP